MSRGHSLNYARIYSKILTEGGHGMNRGAPPPGAENKAPARSGLRTGRRRIKKARRPKCIDALRSARLRYSILIVKRYPAGLLSPFSCSSCGAIALGPIGWNGPRCRFAKAVRIHKRWLKPMRGIDSAFLLGTFADNPSSLDRRTARRPTPGLSLMSSLSAGERTPMKSSVKSSQ